MENSKSNQTLIANDKCKIKNKKTTVKKQLSTPINVTTSIIYAKKKNVLSPQNKNKYMTIASKNVDPNSNKFSDSKCTSTFPLSSSPKKILNDRPKNESCNRKFDRLIIKNSWMCMSDREKHQSTVNLLNTIKNDIITAYEMLTDFRNGDVLRGQLADLSNISSSITGKLDETPNTTTEMLIIETHDKGIQTTGVQLEKLENNLKNSYEENSWLCSERDAAKKKIEQLQCDLEDRTNKFNSKSAQDLDLNLKIEESSKTIDDLKKDIFIKNEKLDTLYDERNKLKYELFDKIKEVDKISEELIIERDKNMELSNSYLKLKSEADEMRSDSINHALEISDKIDEINLRTEEVAHLEKIIAVHQETTDALTEDNEAKSYTIKKLKSKVKWFEETIKSRKNCLINTCVRDKLETKIQTLKNENKQLQTNIQKLSNANDNFVSEIFEHKAELENFQKMKENFFKDQESVIRLMRELLEDQVNNNAIETRIQIKRLLDELQDIKQSVGDYERLMNENWMLKTKNNELNLRLNI